jgi:hypothetical protein
MADTDGGQCPSTPDSFGELDMINTIFVPPDQTAKKTRNIAAALMAAGLFLAVPAFAQTTPAEKQKTQEGGASMPGPTGGAFNADPNYKQRTQEGGPSMPGPTGGGFNADPNYKQRAQEGGPSMPGPTGGGFNADPGYKQRAQNLTPSSSETGGGIGSGSPK